MAGRQQLQSGVFHEATILNTNEQTDLVFDWSEYGAHCCRARQAESNDATRRDGVIERAEAPR